MEQLRSHNGNGITHAQFSEPCSPRICGHPGPRERRPAPGGRRCCTFVSRILSPAVAGGSTVIPLTSASRRPPPAGAGCNEPGNHQPGPVKARADRTGGPFTLFVLHRAGFVMPPALRHGAVGSYPAFSPLPRSREGPWRYVFCDTFRQRGLAPSTARVHHAARCLVVSGLSSHEPCGSQATVSGAAR